MADDLAATLAGIRKRADWISDRYAEVTTVRDSAEDVPRLLAAVEAALGLVTEWKQIPFAVRASDECADELREAITAALTRVGVPRT